jgi:hypothetical protein
MLGLAAEALIHYDKHFPGDPRIVPTLRCLADFLKNHAWVKADKAWWYESYPEGKTPADAPKVYKGAHDLNLMILPMLVWMFQKTGEVSYLALADDAFGSGVRKAWLGNGKQYCQNYRWSFAYVQFRKTIKNDQ